MAAVRRRTILSIGISAAAAILAGGRNSYGQLSGATGAHDPSSMILSGGKYYYYATGQGISSRSSTDKVNWTAGPSVFSTPPAWTTQAVPDFTGNFWAPDVAFFNGLYHLYYSVSSWGTIDSAIGLATSPSLASPVWTDQGKVVQSDAIGFTQPETDTTAFNAIDPSILVDSGTGRAWMSWGSYSSGIVVTELNPTTGKRLNTSSLSATLVANNAAGGGWGSSIEGSSLVKRGSFYYLFVNYGGCCAGIDSTYNIRVGRSASPTGPFLDKNGVDMRNGGGSMFLDDDGKMTGPGHFGYYTEAGQDYFSYHYYNGDSNGAPTYGTRKLYWTGDFWPSYSAVNPNWTGTSSTSWSLAGNWTAEGVPSGVGQIANFSTVSSGRYSVAVDSAKTVSTINFSAPSASYTIGDAAGPALSLDAQSGDSATINVLAGNHTIAAPVTAGDALGVNVTTAGSTLVMSGAVSAPALTKYGRGKLTLGGANTYSGSVLVTAGTLDIAGSVSAGNYTSVGRIVGETATMIVRGTGSFTTNTDLNIGDTGDANTAASGTLVIQDNASVTINTGGGLFVGSGFSANTRATGTVNQSGGTLTANGNFDGAFIIGGRGSSLATGTFNLSGGTVNANTNVRVGGFGTGTLSQTGGTFNAGGHVSIGRFAGASGTWNISAGTLQQNGAASLFIVGEAGSGALGVSGSGQVTSAGSMRVGYSAGGKGAISLAGGTINANGASAPSLSAGAASGAVGSIIVSSGTLATASQLWLGTASGGYGAMTVNAGNVTVGSWLALSRGGGTGILNVNGGSLSINSNNLTIGAIAGGTNQNSVATLTGGTTTVTSGGVYVGEITSGVLNVQGSASLTAGGALGVKLSNTAGTPSSGILNLAGGGTITTPIVQKGAGSSGTMNFNGGTLRASGSTANFMTGLSAANVYSGGATIDTDGNNITIAQALIAPSGSGVTSISLGANGSGYLNTPLVSISGGTLASGGVRATAVVNIDYSTGQVTGITITHPGNYSSTAGLSVSFSGGGGIAPTIGTISTGANTSGGLTKQGAGTLTLSGANTYTGGTNATAGTLTMNASLASNSLSAASGATVNINGSVPANASITASGAVNIAGNASTTSNGARSVGSLVVNPGGQLTILSSAVAGHPMVLSAAGLSFGNSTAKLDLTNNELIVASSLSNVRSSIVADSLKTSTAGLVVGSMDLLNGTIEARATLLGDTNLDGTVDVTDLGNLASNYGAASTAVWVQGDTNYDDKVDVTDLGNLASSYGGALAGGPSMAASATGAAAPISAASVPEPGSFMLIGAGVFALLRRRCFRKSK